MDRRPIGVYDSGIGGLTGLKALRALLPGEELIYFSDSGRMPYGSRSDAELCRIARQDMDYLASFGVKAILAACGTISSAAAAVLRDYPIPAFGVVAPAVEALAAVPGDAPLGILATEASIRSGLFTRPLEARCPGREIVGLPCPEFAPLIEAGHIRPDDPVLRESVARALEPIRGVRFGALLLGCTHYGIIEESMRAFLGADAPLVSAAACGARALCGDLEARGLVSDGRGGARYYVSGGRREFERFAEHYLGEGAVRAEQAPIMEI